MFKVKQYNVEGIIETYETRLVVKDFTQKTGIDYSESFSPVVKRTLIKILFAVVIKWLENVST